VDVLSHELELPATGSLARVAQPPVRITSAVRVTRYTKREASAVIEYLPTAKIGVRLACVGILRENDLGQGVFEIVLMCSKRER
jgi:hypothetical protein